MSVHLCECGHEPSDHIDTTGQCMSGWSIYDVGPGCLCWRYEWAGNE